MRPIILHKCTIVKITIPAVAQLRQVHAPPAQHLVLVNVVDHLMLRGDARPIVVRSIVDIRPIVIYLRLGIVRQIIEQQLVARPG